MGGFFCAYIFLSLNKDNALKRFKMLQPQNRLKNNCTKNMTYIIFCLSLLSLKNIGHGQQGVL
jgi:hypothetical protein